MNEFLEKVRAHAAKKTEGKLVNLSLAALMLARAQPEAFDAALAGLKVMAIGYGKPVVRATLVSIVEAALE